MTAHIASRPAPTTRGVLSCTRRPPRCARISSGPSGACSALRSARRGSRSRPRRAAYRAELSWCGEPGTAAAIASALRGWNHLRFEVTEDPTVVHRGARGTPTRPTWASSTP